MKNGFLIGCILYIDYMDIMFLFVQGYIQTRILLEVMHIIPSTCWAHPTCHHLAQTHVQVSIVPVHLLLSRVNRVCDHHAQ